MKTLTRKLVQFVCFNVAAVALLLGALTMSVRLVGPTLWAVVITLAIYGCFVVGTACRTNGTANG